MQGKKKGERLAGTLFLRRNRKSRKNRPYQASTRDGKGGLFIRKKKNQTASYKRKMSVGGKDGGRKAKDQPACLQESFVRARKEKKNAQIEKMPLKKGRLGERFIYEGKTNLVKVVPEQKNNQTKKKSLVPQRVKGRRQRELTGFVGEKRPGRTREKRGVVFMTCVERRRGRHHFP